MKDYIERMEQEKAELDIKLIALLDFIGGVKFSSLDAIQQGNLKVQRDIMSAYSSILLARIEYEMSRNN